MGNVCHVVVLRGEGMGSGGGASGARFLKALRRSVMKSYLDSERLRRWCPWCCVFVSPLEKTKQKKAQQAFFLIMSLGGPGVQYSQAFLSLVLILLLLLPAVSPSVRQVFPL